MSAGEDRREVHGVHIKEGLRGCPETVRETDTHVIICAGIETKLSPASARHLARTLYRLARRIEKRAASVDRSPKGEDAERLHAEHESAVTPKAADAQTELDRPS